MSATCMQRVIALRGPRAGQWIEARRPHDVPSSSEDGYATCASCGANVYVGQGEMSPIAAQEREGRMARADRRGW